MVKLSIEQINERHNVPANVIELGAAFVQQLVLFGGLSKVVEAFEMGIKSTAVNTTSVLTPVLHSSMPHSIYKKVSNNISQTL
jgi:hypothetical protein